MTSSSQQELIRIYDRVPYAGSAYSAATWEKDGAAVRSGGTVRMLGLTFPVLISVEHAAESIADLARGPQAATIFTCNVDHANLIQEHHEFRRAYERASFVTADGTPIVALSKLLRTPVGPRITGADLVPALAKVAARRHLRMALLGGAAGVAEEAARRLRMQNVGLTVIMTDSPPMNFEFGGAYDQGLVRRLRAARADIVIVCLGAPRQELWIDSHAHELPGMVLLGAGASLDFIAGRQRRAPKLAQRCGLEWLHRLVTNYPRLWRRYLLRGPRFLGIAHQQLSAARRARRATQLRTLSVPGQHQRDSESQAYSSTLAAHPPSRSRGQHDARALHRHTFRQRADR
jgi:N-acetylglucosaminyldiphosphoundecaprenol N-acetyl-beta-D-mannosaminyltransferase